MNQLLNIGGNWIAYIPPIMVLIIALVGYRLVKVLYRLSKLLNEPVADGDLCKQLTKSYIRNAVVIAVCLAFAIFAGFFAYGPGKHQRSTDSPTSGWMERVEKLPDEKPLETIQKEGEAQKDYTGTLPKVATEDEYQKSKEEADKAIEEMLERNKNN